MLIHFILKKPGMEVQTKKTWSQEISYVAYGKGRCNPNLQFDKNT